MAVAFALSAALGLAGPLAASAADGRDEPDSSAADAASAVPTARVVEFPMNPLWTNQYSSYGDTYWRAGAEIFVGTDTRALVLDVDIAAPGPVTCLSTTDYSELPAVTWTEEEWASDVSKTVPITEGFVTDPGDHVVRCNSTSADGQRWWTLQWWLQPLGTALGEVVVLVQDEELLSSYRFEHVYNTLGAPRPVSAGDAVRLVGAPGTWPQGPDPYLADPVITLFSGASGTASLTVDDAIIAADGSTLEFLVPAAPTPGFFTEDATVSVRKAQSTDGFNGEPNLNWETASWSAPLEFAAQPAPTVAVTLSGRYALSFQRLTAEAVVQTTGGSAPTGTITFAVNGKAVGAVPFTAAAGETASFRLPALPRGRYSVTATYTPGAGSQLAVSPGAWLRVLY